MSYHLLSAAFAQFRYQRNAAGGLNIASEASYWCNWRETSVVCSTLVGLLPLANNVQHSASKSLPIDKFDLEQHFHS